MAKLLRRILCRFGMHKRLDVINTFGSAQHIGCPDCGRQYGIHHGMRAIVPWESDIASMYEMFGHDVKGPLAKWQAYRRRLAPAQLRREVVKAKRLRVKAVGRHVKQTERV